MKIHETAIVSDKALIEEGVIIGPYCIVGDEVEIGRGTVLKSHVVIQGPCRIGRDNVFYQFCSIGEIPQDLKFRGERTLVVIGDRNVFRECVTVNRGTEGGGGLTRIGSDNLLMAYCHVAHDCIVHDHVVLANSTNLAGHVTIRDWAVVGGFVGVVQFRTLGEHCYIGAMSKITKDVPPFTIADGLEPRLRGINVVGLSRRGFTKETIRAIKRAYDSVFSGEGPIKQLATEYKEKIEKHDLDDNTEEALIHFLDFLITSSGILTP